MTARPRVLLLVPAHLPGGRLPAGGRADAPGSRRGQRRRAAARRPPRHPVQPGRPGSQHPPDPGPGRLRRRGRRRRHPDARARGGRGRPDGAAAQPRRGRAERHRQGQAAAAVGGDWRSPAGVPARARRGAEDAIRQAAEAIGFPCVVKAVSLSASQGVLRADDPVAAVTAARCIRQVLDAAERPAEEPLLVKEYLPGPELSIDGVLHAGELTVTAVFDKPGTPDGPTFEETLLVSPSRLPGPVLAAAVGTAGQAARALGLTGGPIHAELRIDERAGPAMLELAARSIGGLCSRALRFPGGKTREELVLANALGQHIPAAGHQPARPCAVFMLPVPRPGMLRAVEGRAAAAAVPGITGLTITIPLGQRVLPLPDGDRYLEFIFAEAGTRQEVENAFAAASGRLRVVIG